MKNCATCNALNWNLNADGDCANCVKDQRRAEIALRSGTRTPQPDDTRVLVFFEPEVFEKKSVNKARWKVC